jgi:hypothetical protein
MIDPIGSAPSVISVYGSGRQIDMISAQRVQDGEATESKAAEKAPLPAFEGTMIDVEA